MIEFQKKESFLQKEIAKAYKTLTDEEAKENWKKYGNPDGPGGLFYFSGKVFLFLKLQIFSNTFWYCFTEMVS